MTQGDALAVAVARVTGGVTLTAAEAESAFDVIMAGEASSTLIAALLAALEARGVAPSEVAGGVRALRSAMVPVRAVDADGLVDTCGTGGGRVTTFNVSTAAALVAAGAGARVAKHGNRSFTSKCGSADVLEALGVRIELTPEEMALILEQAGIVFMFAPLLHPAMRHVGPVRKELGIRTIMNLLGPLTNPAGARRQVVGVSDPDLLPLIAGSLKELGHLRALVVHGEAGMDEISPAGPTRVADLADGTIREYSITPEDFGLTPVALDDLAGGEPEYNADLIRRILDGSEQGAPRIATIMNAAAALLVGGHATDFRSGADQAAAAIDSGAAANKLDRLVSLTT